MFGSHAFGPEFLIQHRTHARKLRDTTRILELRTAILAFDPKKKITYKNLAPLIGFSCNSLGSVETLIRKSQVLGSLITDHNRKVLGKNVRADIALQRSRSPAHFHDD